MNSRDTVIRTLDKIHDQKLIREGKLPTSDKIDLSVTYHPVTHIKVEITNDTVSVLND